MNTPLITWACIVALFVIILFVRLLQSVHSHHERKRQLLSFGSEREEFFAPGDANPNTDGAYVYDEDDDL